MATFAFQASNNQSITSKSQVYQQSTPYPAANNQQEQMFHPYQSSCHQSHLYSYPSDLESCRKQDLPLSQYRWNLQSGGSKFEVLSNSPSHEVQSKPRSQAQMLPKSQPPQQHVQAVVCQQNSPLHGIQNNQTVLPLLAALSQQNSQSQAQHVLPGAQSQQNGQQQVLQRVMSIRSLQRIQLQQRYAYMKRILSQRFDSQLNLGRESVQLRLQGQQFINSLQPQEGYVLQTLREIRSQAQQFTQTGLLSQKTPPQQQAPDAPQNMLGNCCSGPNSQQKAPSFPRGMSGNQGGQNSQQQAPGIPRNMLGNQGGQGSRPQTLPSMRAPSTCPHGMPPRECLATYTTYIGCPCEVRKVEACQIMKSRVDITDLGFERCEKYIEMKTLEPGNCGGRGKHWACPAMPKFWHEYQVENADGSVVWAFTPEPYTVPAPAVKSPKERSMEEYYELVSPSYEFM